MSGRGREYFVGMVTGSREIGSFYSCYYIVIWSEIICVSEIFDGYCLNKDMAGDKLEKLISLNKDV